MQDGIPDRRSPLFMASRRRQSSIGMVIDLYPFFAMVKTVYNKKIEFCGPARLVGGDHPPMGGILPGGSRFRASFMLKG